MRAVIQRATHSGVTINGEIKGKINKGFCILLGIGNDDSMEEVDYLASKIVNLRVFEDENGKLNLSIMDIKGEVLIISQFTLYADCAKGRRPSFINAAPPVKAIPLYEAFIKKIGELGIENVQTGEFGADMKVEILNDGPVTIIMDTKEMRG
jgi:D-tyrosyl-tRNA(Tyr) deacylase